MAPRHQILVECPSCKQPGFMGSWPYIVDARDGEAKDLLLRGRLFKYDCPVCGEKSTLVYDCLYQDTARRMLVLYSSRSMEGVDCPDLLNRLALQASQDNMLDLDGYQHRIVCTTFEFCEKLRLLEDGYDDRIVELMKVAIKRGMLQEGIIGARDILIYERTMPDKGVSFIVTGKIPGDVVSVPQGYEYMESTWKDLVDQVQGEYRFDAAWANAFLP